MNILPTSATGKHVCFALMASASVFVGLSQALSQAQPTAETIVGMYHVPDLPQWKKMVHTDSARSLVRYDKTVPEGSLTLKFTRFLQTKDTPAMTRQEFDKDTPQENQLLKRTLAATATQVLLYSTQAVQFQGAPAYLTQYRILRHQRLEEDKSLIFLNAGERYELDLNASQQKPSAGPIHSLQSEKETQQAWNTLFNGLTKSSSK